MNGESTTSILQIPLDKINVVNPRARNRKVFEGIVRNIGQLGLKRPITVIRKSGDDEGRYDLVCGQGRVEAYRALGQKEIPAIVVEASEEDSLVMSLVENIARRQHRAIDLLHDIEGMKRRGYTEEDIAGKTDLTVEYVRGVTRRNRNGSARFYFDPPHVDGWKRLRLHGSNELPIEAEEEAIKACRELSEIYRGWKRDKADYGPDRIDDLGRVLPRRSRLSSHAAAGEPGTIAAICADFVDSEEFTELKPSTQDDYRLCLEALATRFGDRHWGTISAKEAKAWIREKAATHPSMAHQWYRTCRAVLNKTRLIYDERDHAGYVPPGHNPFDSLNVGLPKARLIVWPQPAIDAMVALADEIGRPSLGDAIVAMAWLGVRRQDWLAWPTNIFDTAFLAWDTEKTDTPVTIPWSVIPQLYERIEAAKLRLRQSSIRATTFFVDDVGQRPWNPNRFHAAFDALRSELGKRHESFATRYAVKHYPGDPMRIPTAWLTMRVLRHTCITALHDAGCVREQIRAITGHTIASINEVLDRYTKLTADQAGAALLRRLDHERRSQTQHKTGDGTFVETASDVRRDFVHRTK